MQKRSHTVKGHPESKVGSTAAVLEDGVWKTEVNGAP